MPKELIRTASSSSEKEHRLARSKPKHRFGEGGRSLPVVMISQEMIDEAVRLIPFTKVKRTIASSVDTLTGHLGEFAFAHYYFGDWKKHRVGKNKGETDFPDIEIKTSAFPFSEKLNLLVREDYAAKRKPAYYVQIIVAVDSETVKEIPAHTKAILCGFATASEVDSAPLKDFGSKFGRKGGYKCRYISLKRLHPIQELLQKKKMTSL